MATKLEGGGGDGLSAPATKKKNFFCGFPKVITRVVDIWICTVCPFLNSKYTMKIRHHMDNGQWTYIIIFDLKIFLGAKPLQLTCLSLTQSPCHLLTEFYLIQIPILFLVHTCFTYTF